MRRALTLWVTAVALAAPAAAASAQSRTHVRDVRVGAHEGYERVVVELDGSADIAWERGPEPQAETFYLDADLGRRERVVATQLPQLGTLRLRAMRVGTRLELEPRERRVRAYLLAKPTRLVIDVAAPGPGKFEVPAGLTPLAPAKSVGPLENAPVPEPEPQAEPAPPPVTAQPSPEPVEGAVEAPPEPPAETPTEAAPPEPAPQEAPPQEAAPTGPETAAPAEPAPEPAPQPPPEPPPAAVTPPPELVPPPAPAPPPETGFPWGLALGTLAALAALGGLGVALQRMRAPAEPAPFRPRPKPTPTGVEAISVDELRGAADPTSVLEQRLDDEVRARLALEERLSQAGEELKVLRDRLHRVERRREEAP